MKHRKSYLGAGVPSVLMTLIILLISCFAVLTFISANSEMKLSEKSAAYCDDYYRAETVASDILSRLYDNNFEAGGKIREDNKGNLVYNDSGSDIVIYQNDINVAFVAPINKKQELHVAARVGSPFIDIIQWTVK